MNYRCEFLQIQMKRFSMRQNKKDKSHTKFVML